MGELTWQAAAAANILEARKRNGRIASKKSRSGCTTCKSRRIKCDETHPECRNCINGGRTCGGYMNRASPITISKTSRSLIGQRLSQTLGLQENERRTFDYFLSWTAPRMAGALDKDFWCGQVLQVAQSEPIVLDALLAISILYEHPQFMKSFYPPGDPEISTDPKFQNGVVNIAHPAFSKPPIDEFHVTALMHYNRAISRFKERMDEGTATPLLALLTCTLFICTEVIRDHVFGALGLFTQGIKLLSQYEPNGDTDTALFLNLRLMFARFGLQTALFGHSGRVEVPADLTDVNTEEGFSDILHARTSLYALTTEVHDCIRAAAEFSVGPGANLPPTNFVDDYPTRAVRPGDVVGINKGVSRLYYGCVDDSAVATDMGLKNGSGAVRMPPPDYSTPISPSDEILGRQSTLRERLLQWHDAFKKTPFCQVEDETNANLLMQCHIFMVWLDACLSPFEMAFDQFAEKFEEILRLADIFTRCKPDRPTFTLEAGVMPHLYFVATKCRVPSLRRRAVELMHKAPLKESMHGATSVAEFVNRIIAIEEEDLYSYPTPPGSSRNASQSPPIDDSILPAESKRVQNLEILMNEPASRFEIRVTRHSYDAAGRRTKLVEDYPV
ncbi:hypothetical protein M409DRAFT_20420 [Zasmidium cellare ATCC 36951]|uniref:Zn(2)-C6 fungal-type domain-containing protein n=1 Tax=Zasmidium cellare ATCC 36951 TaxID=1080233 RepID=A0A6A6CPI5_ZASCE|nr:uncharacterized protein M409DRAFT_20420 [Zasmidium cellare ATCC 36951]KAF2169197.1 hypothetical protein M409DRAFT_20420 [Zasmidium cellare ATCC 36951]